MNALQSLARWGVRVLVPVWCLSWAALAQAALPIEHWVRPDGARVYLVHTNALPMVDVQIDVDGGSRRDPADQAGLAQATALMLGKGIAATTLQRTALDENAVTEAWADLGSQFSVQASRDRLSVRLRSLAQDDIWQASVDLAARQLAAPAFAAPVWARERDRWVAAWREAQTQPDTLAEQSLAQLVYGPHPYGQQARPPTLERIDVPALRQFYQRHAQACTARVTVVGQLERAQAERAIDRLLAGWQGHGCAALPPVAEVGASTAAQTVTLPFASAAQAQILVGQRGLARSDPDFLAFMLGNHILGGGGFTSRLMQELREKRGLTYGVWSSFAPGRHAGAFTASIQTRPDQAALALDLLRQELSRFVVHGPTEQEVKEAKTALINGFALRLDSNRKLLDNVAAMAWNDLPLDHLEQWPARVAALTRDDVARAMARVLHPEHWSTVVVGAQP